jgi:hypothetical protein
MWVTTTDLPTAASHPFYTRLNQLLHEHGFDDFAEAQCATFYKRRLWLEDANGSHKTSRSHICQDGDVMAMALMFGVSVETSQATPRAKA